MTRAEKQAARNKRLIAKGLCPDCAHAPPVPGKRLCVACAKRKLKAAHRRIAKLAEQNLCRKCKINPPVKDRQRCSSCLTTDAKRMTAKRQGWLTQGLCGTCGKQPLFTKSSCEPCSVKQTARTHGLTPERYLELLAAGCGICGSHEDLHIDHDHRCCRGRNKKGCGNCVREALCRTHNTMLGWLEHPDISAALAYLKKHERHT